MNHHDPAAAEDLKFSAFLEPDSHEIEGLKLRPFTTGSYLMAERRGLTLFTGKGAATEAEQAWQMMAFLFIHAAPMPEVLIACGNDEAFRQAVDAFSFSVPFSVFEKAIHEIRRRSEQVAAASVTVEAKPSADLSKETPPPNS